MEGSLWADAASLLLDLEADDTEAGEGISTVVKVAGGLYMLLGRRLRLPGPRSAESSLSADSKSKLLLLSSGLSDFRDLERPAAAGEGEATAGDAGLLSLESFPPLECFAAL